MSSEKERAIKLYDKFIFPCWECDEFDRAKQCALIAVYEIMKELDLLREITGSSAVLGLIEYYQEVKKEIDKL